MKVKSETVYIEEIYFPDKSNSVKTKTTELKFDKNGKLIEVISFEKSIVLTEKFIETEDENIVIYETYENGILKEKIKMENIFDRRNRIRKQSSIDVKGNLSEITYEYNSKGDLVRIVSWEDGIEKDIIEFYEYKNICKINQKIEPKEKNVHVITSQKSQNKLVELMYDSNGKMTQKWVRTLDNEGNISSDFEFDSNDNLVSSEYNEYDEKKKLIKKNRVSQADKLSSIIYNYSQEGFLLSSETIEFENKTTIKKTIITHDYTFY